MELRFAIKIAAADAKPAGIRNQAYGSTAIDPVWKSKESKTAKPRMKNAIATMMVWRFSPGVYVGFDAGG
jgi:hypothetical protein